MNRAVRGAGDKDTLPKDETRHTRRVGERVKVLAIGAAIDLCLTIVSAHSEACCGGVKTDV